MEHNRVHKVHRIFMVAVFENVETKNKGAVLMESVSPCTLRETTEDWVTRHQSKRNKYRYLRDVASTRNTHHDLIGGIYA